MPFLRDEDQQYSTELHHVDGDAIVCKVYGLPRYLRGLGEGRSHPDSCHLARDLRQRRPWAPIGEIEGPDLAPSYSKEASVDVPGLQDAASMIQGVIGSWVQKITGLRTLFPRKPSMWPAVAALTAYSVRLRWSFSCIMKGS